MISDYAHNNGYPFYCLTASNEDAIAIWKETTAADYTFCHTDETTLKTIIRSNPGLLLLKDGTIIRKWSHNFLPVEELQNQRLEDSAIGQMPDDDTGHNRIYQGDQRSHLEQQSYATYPNRYLHEWSC